MVPQIFPFLLTIWIYLVSLLVPLLSDVSLCLIAILSCQMTISSNQWLSQLYLFPKWYFPLHSGIVDLVTLARTLHGLLSLRIMFEGWFSLDPSSTIIALLVSLVKALNIPMHIMATVLLRLGSSSTWICVVLTPSKDLMVKNTSTSSLMTAQTLALLFACERRTMFLIFMSQQKPLSSDPLAARSRQFVLMACWNSLLGRWVFISPLVVLPSRKPPPMPILRLEKLNAMFELLRRLVRHFLRTQAFLCPGEMWYLHLNIFETIFQLPCLPKMLHHLRSSHIQNPMSLIFVYGGASVLFLFWVNSGTKLDSSTLKQSLLAMKNTRRAGEFVI